MLLTPKVISAGQERSHNIVPNSTEAAKAIGLVLPELKGKLDGSTKGTDHYRFADGADVDTG
jgi:hypothetical protein